ncbi:MAG: AsmA family protein [Desulfovermiculus sp.]|nr:AsmA family protein [Desulfovermiculus sp.]
MLKALKYILYALAGIIIILVLVIGGVVMFVDPNDYRDRIEQAASEQLGRSLQINGPIELSFYPWIGLEVQDITLANAQGFAPEHMLSVHKAGLKVKLLPLISREVQVGTLLLQEATFNLAKDGQGKTNWQDLAAQSASEKTTPESETGQEPSGSPTGMAALSIQEIQIQDTHLNWVDKQAGTQLAVRDVNMDMGPVSLDKPIPFSLRCRIEEEQTGTQSELTITGQTQVDVQNKRFQVDDLDIKNLISGENIPGGEAEVHVQTSMSLNLDTGAMDMPQFSLSAYDLRITAQAQGESLFSSPSFTGRIGVQPFNPQDLMARLDLPRMETADPQALTSVQAQTKFAGTPSRIELSSLNATLDDTTIQGQASADLTKAVPASSFDLHMDEIDVDRYLPPAQKETKPKTEPQKQDQDTAEAPEEEEPSTAALPLAPLRQLTMDGRIRINTMKIKGMRMEDITLTVKAKDGQVDISPLQSRLYGGTLHSTASLDVRGKTPKMNSQAKLDTVRIQSLLQDMTGKDLLSGLGSVQTTFSTQGLDARSMLKALDGNLKLDLQDGSFQGADLLHRIRSTYLTLKGKAPDESGTEETKFSSLTFGADIVQGIVQKSDLKLVSSLFSVQGSGRIDLLQRSLDYLLQVNFDKDLTGQYPELSDLEGKEIPLDVKGSLADPRLGLNQETLIKILGQDKISEEVDKGMQNLQEKLGLSGSDGKESSDTGQKAKEALKSLFGDGKSD